ncbi:hypothetical protein C491_17172 [Natronococcus amylolyticus DSM 10524]|uniref:Uncharacterized protein n=1 Tax=Natronococcus amylolyticus DSM 10524 TaxID=1227497 RepID=L9X1X7_9EURY|nr:hypothetical protein C491_17172 [Natronococcus amylolyticus DSM 10524]
MLEVGDPCREPVVLGSEFMEFGEDVLEGVVAISCPRLGRRIWRESSMGVSSRSKGSGTQTLRKPLAL